MFDSGHLNRYIIIRVTNQFFLIEKFLIIITIFVGTCGYQKKGVGVVQEENGDFCRKM